MRLATIIAGAMQLSTISALSAAAKLRAVLQAPGAVVCPGVHDALSTRVFAEAGAKAMFVSGFGVSACRGEPDAGIITRVEMEEVARQCVAAAGGVPLIVDGDTGFGGASNLRRTVHGFAAAGAAAVSIEDQAFPSDEYAVQSVVSHHGLDPEQCIVRVPHGADFVAAVEAVGERCAVVLVGALQYRDGAGLFNFTSTCVCSKRFPRGKHPGFEFAPRDDRSSQNEPKRVENDRDTRF